MVKINLPYVEKNVAKGRTYYRYRREGVRLNLPTDPTSLAFAEAYDRIHKNFYREEIAPVIRAGSIAALITDFRKSAEFKSLKPRVQKLYLSNLDIISDKLGQFQAEGLTRRVALEWRDTFADQPAKANNLIRCLSRLCSFGLDRGYLNVNPLIGIKKLKLGEWRPWQPQEIDGFRRAASNTMRLALELALFTGQRLGDVIAMRWDQITDGGIEVTQEKTGAKIWIPLHQELQATLGTIARRDDETTILVSTNGQPFKSDHFKHEFKDATRKAGLADDLVFHGLRKTAAVMLAEAGCSTEQIKAITGHRTDIMAATMRGRLTSACWLKRRYKKWRLIVRGGGKW